MPSILIIEDDAALGTALSFAARRVGHLPTLVASGAAGLEAWKREAFSAIVLDIGLPDMSGLKVLEKLRAKDATLPVLVITAHATLDHAISAQKAGATHYLPKPLDLAQFETALRALLAKHVSLPATPASPAVRATTLIGTAPLMQPVFIGIARAVASDVPVLIHGPSGAGKTLAARVIHAHGTRALHELHELHVVAGNAMSDVTTLLAGRGTVLIESAESMHEAQQRHLAEWLSDSRPTPSARVIVACGRDPAEAFLPELYYALAALRIPLPALSARAGDVPALAAFFLGLQSEREIAITPPAMAALQSYAWPGHVRELRHALDYAAAASRGEAILLAHLPPHIAECGGLAVAAVSGELEASLARWIDHELHTQGDAANYDALLDQIEAQVLRHLLAKHEGKPTHMAATLKMNRSTLRQKLRRAGLSGEGE